MQQLMMAAVSIIFAVCASCQTARAEDAFGSGVALFKSQSYLKALQAFSDCKTSGEKESQRIYYCALCCLQIGQLGKAREYFKRVCSEFPHSGAAELSRQYLNSSVQTSTALSNNGPASGSVESLPDAFVVPFQKTSKGQLAVEAQVNGHSMRMIFDTGAEECLLGTNQIESANLTGVDRGKTTVLNSVSGPVQVYEIDADINLGNLHRRLPVSVQDHEMEAGILGQPFLRGYSWSLDNQAGLIRLLRDAGGDSSDNAPVDSFAIPYYLAGDKMIVSASVHGRTTDMCFDTGAFGVVMSKRQYEKFSLRLPYVSPIQTRGPNGLSVPSWDMTLDISLGPICSPSCPVRVIDAEIQFPLLGLKFFGQRTYSIDRARKEIRFAH